jgi:5S rRNA maturation endonuclease (ribonuclease M5)
MSSGDLQDLSDWCDRLSKSKKAIIVEGPKDKKSLRDVGISNNIIMLNKRPLYAVVEEAAEISKEIVILTDLDKEGKRLFGRLNSDLQRFGVRVDNCFREFLFKHTKLRQIEGISTYLATLSPDKP